MPAGPPDTLREWSERRETLSPAAAPGSSERTEFCMAEEGTRRDRAEPVATWGVLVRYRVMAFTTATLLIVLVFLGIPLQLAAGRPGVVNVVGTMHGFLYLVYLVVAFELTRKMRVPKWQMVLVLLAGTVPFCAFIAERKLTRRFEALVAPREEPERRRRNRSLRAQATSFRRRWLSRRALLLHLEVAIVAPGCGLAGWWQATRALSGNDLSWVYSVEWPIFGLLAIAGWWQLVHEDPAAYRARKARHKESGDVFETASGPQPEMAEFGERAVRLSLAMSALVALEFLAGIATAVLVPFGRPSGWFPRRAEPVYLAHALLGFLLALCAVALLSIIGQAGRAGRAAGWMGLVGLVLAGAGGLLTEPHSLLRFLGMAVMFVGTSFAGFAYLIPSLSRRRRSDVASSSRQHRDDALGLAALAGAPEE